MLSFGGGCVSVCDRELRNEECSEISIVNSVYCSDRVLTIGCI